MDEQTKDSDISQADQANLNLSHGIKNILQAITGGREVVDKSLKINDIERARRGWAILNKNLGLIEKLVLDMLRLNTDIPLRTASCSLNEIVTAAVETLSITAQNQNKKLTVKTDKTIPLLHADRDGIYDVVLNLVLNALDAVKEQTGEISVTTRYDEQDNRAVMKVSDNGPGIENPEAIFRLFHTSKKKSGIGLGLPIAKKIVNLHSGEIMVHSESSKGATFIVTLPIKKAAEDF